VRAVNASSSGRAGHGRALLGAVRATRRSHVCWVVGAEGGSKRTFLPLKDVKAEVSRVPHLASRTSKHAPAICPSAGRVFLPDPCER
jgi:hypothetical protein